MDFSFSKTIQQSRLIKALPQGMIIPSNKRDNYYSHFSIKVRTLVEYIDVICRLRRICNKHYYYKTMVFRGHSDASSNYKLVPGIARNDLAIEHRENDLVTEMITLRPEEFQGISSNFDLLAKLQHFGIPTRLLDFTFNPLIALYFACEGERNLAGRVLCTYDTSSLFTRELVEKICGMYQYGDYNAISLDRVLGSVSSIIRYGINTLEPLMSKPKYLNDRIKHQSAVFMVFPNEIIDLRSLMVVRGRNIGKEEDYRFFTIDKDELKRLEFVREEPDFYDNSFFVNFKTIREMMQYYANKFSDFYNKTGDGINPKYHFLFKDRFSVSDSIQEIQEDCLSNCFISIIIDSPNKKTIMKDLETIGISKAFVFPELEYTAEMIKKKY